MRLNFDKKRLLFVLLPLVAACWPVWLASVAMPGAQRGWQEDIKKRDTARDLVKTIIGLDPDRLQNVDAKGKLEKFEYPIAVNRIASACNISPASYKVNVLTDVKPTAGQASQNAIVIISKVPVKTAVEFVSMGETRYYPNLKCIQLTFKKLRDQKDSWDVDLTFTHYE
jgi:hypothetical protein